MAANRNRNSFRSDDSSRGEEGQSLLEFLLFLPLLVGMTVVLVRANQAIQMSVVNQQYSRAQALFIAHNSAEFPRRRHHERFAHTGSNQMILGVSENNIRMEDGDGNEYVPKAQTQMVARNRRLAGGVPTPGEWVDSTGTVRIRNTVSLCAPSIVMKGGNGRVGPDMPEIADAKSLLYCASRLEGMETLR